MGGVGGRCEGERGGVERGAGDVQGERNAARSRRFILLMPLTAHGGVDGEAVGFGYPFQSRIRPIQRADGADHEGLATLLRADGDTVGHRTAQDMGHGISLFGWIQVQPCALAILLQQPLSSQAATYSLADQLNQIPQLVFNRRFDALETRGPVVAIDVYAIQKQDVKMYIEV